MLRGLALTLSVLGIAPMAAAAPPAAMPVQGRLTNLAGEPVTDGSYGMAVRVYGGPDAGAAVVWQKDYPAIAVSEGLFTIVVGQTEPLPLPAIVSADALWVAVAVSGEPELPRQRVWSVPYAMVSAAVACTGCIEAGHIAAGAIEALGFVPGPHLSASEAVAAALASGLMPDVAGGTGGESRGAGGKYGNAIGGNGAPGRTLVTAP